MKPILIPYISAANMLVHTFGPDCEVVLHDLDVPEHSVVHVAGSPVTGRKPGDSFDHLVRQVLLSENLKEDYVANYYFTAPDGRLVRSSTLLIKNMDGHLEGALCINLDTTRISEQIRFLQSFLPEKEPAATKTEEEAPVQAGHVAVMIEKLMDGIIGNIQPSELSREERIEKIRFMETKGIFLMKGSIDKAAEKLGVNKVTVYSYLDEVRGKRK
jgi:predicted transcriptional regulator YheO